MSSPSFQYQPPNTQPSGRPMPVALQDHIPRSMMPLWGVSFRYPDAPGRTADFLTPGGPSEEGILEPINGQPVYRRERSYPGTSTSAQSPSSIAPLQPYLYLPPTVSVPFHEQPITFPPVYVPDSGSFSNSSNFLIPFPTAAPDPNFAALPDAFQAAWEHHPNTVLVTSPEPFPVGMQASNYANDHPAGGVNPMGAFQLSFGGDARWRTSASTSPSYNLTPNSASSPSTSSQGFIDTHFYSE
ncbi:hypothetical protein APHAL10511_001564 [Amanita phalloides]|nr:hypothetical protein APHAL10511_001564 [Amanita phalloides]